MPLRRCAILFLFLVTSCAHLSTQASEAPESFPFAVAGGTEQNVAITPVLPQPPSGSSPPANAAVDQNAEIVRGGPEAADLPSLPADQSAEATAPLIHGAPASEASNEIAAANAMPTGAAIDSPSSTPMVPLPVTLRQVAAVPAFTALPPCCTRLRPPRIPRKPRQPSYPETPQRVAVAQRLNVPLPVTSKDESSDQQPISIPAARAHKLDVTAGQPSGNEMEPEARVPEPRASWDPLLIAVMLFSMMGAVIRSFLRVQTRSGSSVIPFDQAPRKARPPCVIVGDYRLAA